MRTLEEVNLELIKAKQDIDQTARLDAMINDLQSQYLQRQNAVEESRAVLAKEERDVAELERLSFASFIARIKGELEERTEQERREAVAAKARYDAADRDLVDLQLRQMNLRRQRNDLGNPERRYRELLSEKEAIVLATGVGPSARLDEIAQKLGDLDFQLREVSEALAAGRNAIFALRCMDDELASAANWGTWDMFGGGMLSTMAKHDHLERAQQCAYQARCALSSFRTELADVSRQQVPDVEISQFDTFADYFFDGFFADMFVQEKIRQAQNGVFNSLNGITPIIYQLEAHEEHLLEEKARLEQERDWLLTSI